MRRIAEVNVGARVGGSGRGHGRRRRLCLIGLVAIAAAATSCNSGPSLEETGPSLQIQMVVPATFPGNVVAGGDIVISGATEEKPKFLGATGIFELNGVPVVVQARDETGDGHPDVVVSFGTNPLRENAAEIFLYGIVNPFDQNTFTQTPPLLVQARLYGGEGQVIARGEATLDTNGEAVRFGPTDRRVLVSLTCVSPEACNAEPAREKVRVSVTRAPNCPGANPTGLVYALLDPRSASGEPAVARSAGPISLVPGVTEALPAVEVTAGIYRVTAVLDSTGDFEARGRQEGAGDLVSSFSKTIDVFVGHTSHVELVLDRVVGVGNCLGQVAGPPTLVATVPVSAANDNSPRVRGTALPGATVRLYDEGTCSGVTLGEGAADPSGVFDIQVSVADDSTTTFFATVTDLDGTVSPCSGGNLTYVEDSSAPKAPAAGSFVTEPLSPSTVVVPLLKGTIEPGALISVHLASDCSDTPAGFGTADRLSQGIRVSVTPNATSTLSVLLTDLAGNRSPCFDTGVTYRHDVIPPDPPGSIQISPASPSADATPTLTGTIEDGATVAIFTTANCSGTPVTGTAAQLAAGIDVPVVPNGATSFSVRVTDSTGNSSSCVPLGQTYVHDSVSPPLPSGLSSDPVAAGAQAAPIVRGVVDAGSTVAIHVEPGCTDAQPVTASASELAAGVAVMVPAEQTTTFSFIVTDEAGNASACMASSLAYRHDSMAPAPPTVSATSPASPSTLVDLVVNGTSEPGATVRLYINDRCAGTAAVSAVADGAGAFAIPTVVGTNSKTSFYATATDAAGNTSGCSTTQVTFENDLAGPIFPGSINATAGNRESQVSWPAAFDLVSTIQSYDFAWCEGAGCTVPTTPQEPDLSPSTTDRYVSGLTNCTSYTFFVRATDALGNVGDWASVTRTPVIDRPGSLTVAVRPGYGYLSWSGVSFASGYEFCYGGSGFSTCTGTAQAPYTTTRAVVAPLPFGATFASVRAFDGSCAGASRNATISQAAPPGFALTYGGSGSAKGTSIVVTGDLDGDGHPDLILPDPGNRWVQAYSPAKNTVLFTRFSPSGGLTWGFGTNAAALGDIDGDGRADMVAGMPAADMPDTGNGGLRFLSGRVGDDIRTVFGDAGEGLGRAVAGIEDLDGDGITDVVAGSNDRVRLVSGATGTTLLSLPSPEMGDDFGAAVASIGLVGGQPRYVVGAPQATPSGGAANAGSVYLYQGTSATPVARIDGAFISGGHGTVLSGPGDLNGDGVPDFIVGTPTSSDLSRIFAYSGLDGALLYSINGTSSAGEMGASLSPAGDLDGDGRADFIVGVPARNLAQVYSGGTGTLILQMARSTGRFGQGVAAVDGDGDGRVDFYLGAPTERITGPDSISQGFVHGYPGTAGMSLSPIRELEPVGRVYRFGKSPSLAAFSGSSLPITGATSDGGALSMQVATGNSGSPGLSAGQFSPGTMGGVYDTLRFTDFTVFQTVDVRVPVLAYTAAREITVNFPSAITGGTDVDKDGMDDILVGASSVTVGAMSFAGNVTVYSGATGMVLHSIDGTAASEALGAAVVGLGDLNADGHGDFAVGAPGFNSNQGQVTVYSGQTGTPLYAAIMGPSASTGPAFGSRLANLGDVDGDGRDDLLIGAPGVDGPAGTNTGAVFVYSGATGALVHQLDGNEASQSFGNVLAAGGDFDNDGIGDYIVGVPGAFESAGFASVHSGATGVELLQINGSGPNDKFGQVVGILPDHTADGIAELLVGNDSSAATPAKLTVISGGDRTQLSQANYLVNVAVVGDLDGDGASEFLAGDGTLFSSRGQIALYSSRDGTRRFLQNGGTSERLGRLVGAAGDVNGDGRNDFLVLHLVGGMWTVSVWTSQFPAPPPARPTSLAATTISATQVDLTWVDNATGETGYVVERLAPGSSWFVVANLAADATTYSATNLTANSQYFWRVKAKTAQADSAWSPVVLTTTLAVP